MPSALRIAIKKNSTEKGGTALAMPPFGMQRIVLLDGPHKLISDAFVVLNQGGLFAVRPWSRFQGIAVVKPRRCRA